MGVDSIDLFLLQNRRFYIIKDDADVSGRRLDAAKKVMTQLNALNGRCGFRCSVLDDLRRAKLIRVGYEESEDGGAIWVEVSSAGTLSVRIDGKGGFPVPGLLFDGASWVGEAVDDNIVPTPGQPVPRKSALHVLLEAVLTASSRTLPRS